MAQGNQTGRKPVGDAIRIPDRAFGEVEVRADTFSSEDRTVEIIWAAGAKVRRYSWDEGYFMEELSMDASHIRMDRFASGMSLLDSHDAYSMDNRIGTVIPGSVRVDGGKAYATVRLSRNQRGESIYQDLQDGHPFPVSVGYRIHAYEKTEGDDSQLPTLRAIDWEPLELSAVPIPADAGAFSRSEAREEAAVTVAVSRRDNPNAGSATSGDKGMANQPNKTGKKPGEEGNPSGADGARSAEDEASTDETSSEDEAATVTADTRSAPASQSRSAAPAPTQQTDTRQAPAADPEAVQRAAQTAATEAVRHERVRTETITDLGRRYGMTDDFVRQHIRDGSSETAFKNAVTEAMLAEQERTGSFPHIETRGMQDEVDTRRSLVANALLHRSGVVTELQEGAREWRDMSMVDTAKELMRARGESTRGSVNEVVKRALHSTSDFPAILGEVTRQTLVAGYESYENTFQLISNRQVVSDFRDVKMLEIGNGPDLLPVNEHGEFKRGTLKESEESFKIGTFGRVFGLTRQMIINDQLNAFARVIQDWGRKAAKLEGDMVWGVIIDNAKLKDGKGLFHADHKNLGTPTALSTDALTAARTMFRKQVDIDGEPINVPPQYLFVGSDLEIPAQKIITGVTVPNTTANVVPEAIRSLTPVYEYRLDKISATVWFLFASMQATMGRGLQHAYLSGQEQPFFDERLGFDVDGIEYKIRHDFGAGLTDYRFAYKNAGA
ncbi:hypothetical protein H9Q09_01115 [Aurantimonas sp. DM33-3]|uniref:prohead protease/major capsid protein fusion protein n=1 Tax=Aurantimonas sp. DM33-3 TaxID=2766955 RepID=UPI0016528411|nr:prohead protease/major capsid protein fusion protein [Aurantimonas sp. DM33-3]MBC6714785.1 hypothetical protein [Aurantimonas sp. DM33-3]